MIKTNSYEDVHVIYKSLSIISYCQTSPHMYQIFCIGTMAESL